MENCEGAMKPAFLGRKQGSGATRGGRSAAAWAAHGTLYRNWRWGAKAREVWGDREAKAGKNAAGSGGAEFIDKPKVKTRGWNSQLILDLFPRLSA